MLGEQRTVRTEAQFWAPVPAERTARGRKKGARRAPGPIKCTRTPLRPDQASPQVPATQQKTGVMLRESEDIGNAFWDIFESLYREELAT
ncbi:hypothetical protein NDU88_001395 [Pleurodeles waltl]|uniref:Uncharacterized protein n=1 Tax=Pleurodeles waltl TaxID=8319 RepID=A0AAV7THQ2_PLEWA|nr:hypothetical protein NDU88_001395 [Pleurodeles waltl]